ncbi:OprD family porin [Stutzerimonas urumqiensis]|uniref:OprD family porin n=1 Tax=Stutzerimonas urumqiensis TaxID=638269 RepID=UPI003BAAF205
MLKTPIARGVALATLGASLAIPSMAQAAFFEDSKASLELRNFYFNGDNRHDVGRSSYKDEEWAQGFLLKYQSGFTEGTVGFGVDALGLLGVKLDSSPDRTGSGLLPVGDDGYADDDYGNIGLTGKARISKSTLYVGTLIPKLPVVQATDSRLLPQTFRGGQLVSEEVSGLNLSLGRLTEESARNEAGYQEKLYLEDLTGLSGNEADWFDFASASYKWSPALSTTYSYGHLDDNYRQHIVNLLHVLPIGEGQSLKTDVRYARTSEDGNTDIDNKAFGAMATYSLSGHSLGLGYQQMNGDSGFAYIDGTDAFLVNYVMISPHFAYEDEKSWQVRYDYNFASMGIPGLSFMTRYVKGEDFGADGNGEEWERDTDIAYVIQGGPLKNLGIKWRNGTYRGENAAGADRDVDQNRLIVSYTLPLL